MMLNPMAAGLPEAQWTHYYPGSDVEDCEYRVEEMEILGVTQKYIMIRGTALIAGAISINMPAGVKPYYPLTNSGFVIYCYYDIEDFEYDGDIVFKTGTVGSHGPSSNVILFTNEKSGSLFLLFARIQ